VLFFLCSLPVNPIIPFVLALSLLLPAGQQASAIAHALESHYRHARTLRASFFESYSDGSGGFSAESGTVYFSRPGRMRWEYESPEEKLFIVDGTNAWFYIPADHTASRARMKDSSDWRTPLALLTGKASLSQLCRSIEIVDAGSGFEGDAGDKRLSADDAVLRCIPRDNQGDSELPFVILEIDPQGRLARVVIHEPGNVRTEFRFGNWEENIPIPEAKFHFQPPPGVAIVDEESLAGAIP
jgi:outer membrane lipoprotein carrier protein